MSSGKSRGGRRGNGDVRRKLSGKVIEWKGKGRCGEEKREARNKEKKVNVSKRGFTEEDEKLNCDKKDQ